MTVAARESHTAPVPARRRERVLPWALAAAGIALAGVAVNVWRPTAPPSLGTVTDLDDFPRRVLDVVATYRTPRRAAAAAQLALTVAVPVAFVATDRGRRLVARLAGHRPRSLRRAAVVAVAVTAAVDLATFPLAYAFGFVHEGAWGFRTSSFGGWLRDWAITHVGIWLLAGAVGAGFVWMVGRWPRTWHWRAVVVGTVVAGVLVMLGPVVLEPLLLDTRPLDAGATRTAVEDVLDRSGDAGARILVGDASRRTTRVNAYVSGLGPSRRVVLYDNLLELPPDRVAAVVAHELAHRQHEDIPRGVALTGAAILPLALATRAAIRSPWVRDRLQLRGPGDPRIVAVGAAVLAVATLAATPIGSAVSRRVEAAADHGALELTRDPTTLVRVERGFVVRDLADPRPPAWTVVLFGSHPSPAERIQAAVDFATRNAIPLPEVAEVELDERTLLHDRLR